jgi:leucyl-tRNA synthetase
LPVDEYVGGSEHAVMHLLYARFVAKALRDLDYLDVDEPFAGLTTQGMVLGADGAKMSKSGDNGVSPARIVREYGADTARTFVLGAAEPQRDFAWNPEGVQRRRRLLDRVHALAADVATEAPRATAAVDATTVDRALSPTAEYVAREVDATVASATEAYGELRYDRVVRDVDDLVSLLARYRGRPDPDAGVVARGASVVVRVLAPIAPHVCEEAWECLVTDDRHGDDDRHRDDDHHGTGDDRHRDDDHHGTGDDRHRDDDHHGMGDDRHRDDDHHGMGDDSDGGAGEFVANAAWPTVERDLDDHDAASRLVERTREDVRDIVATAGIDDPERVAVVVAPEWAYDALALARDAVGDTGGDPGEVTSAIMADASMRERGETAAAYARDLAGGGTLPANIGQKRERTALEGAAWLLEREFDATVDVRVAAAAAEDVAARARPGRPAIQID